MCTIQGNMVCEFLIYSLQTVCVHVTQFALDESCSGTIGLPCGDLFHYSCSTKLNSVYR